MFYELNSAGVYVSDIVDLPDDTVPDVTIWPNWTAEPFPWLPTEPVYQRVFVGERDDVTGEWMGEWTDAGPAPIPDEAKSSYYQGQVTGRYDAEAQTHGFMSHRSLLDRAGYPGDSQTLAKAFGEWMDDCNQICALATGGVDPSEWPEVDALIASFPAFTTPVPTSTPIQPGWLV